MNQLLSESLRELAVHWDRLARINSEPGFEETFFEDLEKLNRFARDFPNRSAAAQIKLLELKVLTALKQRHRESNMRKIASQPETGKTGPEPTPEKPSRSALHKFFSGLCR